MSSKKAIRSKKSLDLAWVRKTFRKLSLEEKVGQMIMPAFRGIYLCSSSPEFLELKRQITHYHFGGFILYAGDVYESAVLIDRLQAFADIPLLISSDFERGACFRIRNSLSLPWNMAIGATGSEEWAYFQGNATGQEARALGVNWVLAPVLDVNNNPSNPVINIRSYGGNPELVSRLGVAFIRGVQETGVLATAKHFPGHGDTSVDSHLSLPVIHAGRKRLESVEWPPFKRAIRAGVWSVMSAHVSVPSIDPTPGLPATLSRRVLTDVLQNQLGFSRLIVTDSLTMSGLTENYWVGDAAVRAVKAGVDVLLDPPTPSGVYEALLSAIRRKEIDPRRIDRSVHKILKAKAWLGLTTKPRLDLRQVSRVINNPTLRGQAQELADASVTLVCDQNNIVPVDVRRLRSVHVNLVLGRGAQEETSIFEAELKNRLERISYSRISPSSTQSEMDAALQSAAQADFIICAAFARVITASGTVGLPEKLANWVQRLASQNRPAATIGFGNPYIIEGFPRIPLYLCTFSNADVSQRSAVKALFGEINISGRLPVSIPRIADFGAGILRDRIEMRLTGLSSATRQDTPQELLAVRSHLEATVDNLFTREIEKKSFPGGSVAIGYRNRLVFHHGYGKISYFAKSPAVTTDTIYDLASLTKIVSTTTLAMQLFEQGQLILDDPLTRFYPSFTGGGRERISVRHLLTHTSGLPAHLPLYRQANGKQETIRKILNLTLKYETGGKAEYSDLGIILLGDIIEKLTGMTLDALSDERIFRPLGMSHTLFNPPVSIRSQIAPTERDLWRRRLLRGEVHDENTFAMGGVAGHAGLFGTSGDLAVFCQMILNGGVYDHHRVVFRSTLDKFTARQQGPDNSSRALGWDTPSEGSSAGTLLSSKAFGHTGFTGTSIWIDPSRELFMVLLTNRVYPTRNNNAIREFRRHFADAVVKVIDASSKKHR
jgi:beta-N-acetylhexosaminidase